MRQTPHLRRGAEAPWAAVMPEFRLDSVDMQAFLLERKRPGGALFSRAEKVFLTWGAGKCYYIIGVRKTDAKRKAPG